MKKIFALTTTLFLIFSLCSCDLLCACEKDINFPEENYDAPEKNSIVKYEFDNGYKLTLLYTSASTSMYTSEDALLYGELQTGDETIRMCVWENPRIDTCWQHGRDIVGFDLIMFEIDEQPTADVAEVKHGEWIYNVKYYSCSICAGKRFNLLLGTDAEFCPYCGAKMDGERRDT